ncbi:MAG: F0F1 ATP synthase subunit epsilon [Chloroflexota bacterium]
MMRLRVILPDQIFLDTVTTSVAAEGLEGSFVLLPRHIDYTTVLVPGLLSYTNQDAETVYLAVDHGTLVKKGSDVYVSVWNAVRAEDLNDLYATVKDRFLQLSEQEKRARSVLASLEVALVRQFIDLEKAQQS